MLSGCLLMAFLGLGPLPPLRAIAQPGGHLTREQRDQLHLRANELLRQAEQLSKQGQYPDATKRWQQILAIHQQLYPKDQYPHGHPYLATSLYWLGLMLQAQGDYAGARGYCERALTMRQGLYPKDQYPRGHPDLAQSLSNMGLLLKEQGKYARARGYAEQALAMRQALYPKEKHPHGHPDLAQSLNNLGSLVHEQGDYGGARRYHAQALAMRQALYPKDQFPDGHADIANSLNNLGLLLMSLGDYTGAQAHHQQALHMRRALYPKSQYPRGHYHLANTLHNLGLLLHSQGNYAGARAYYEQALAMRQALYPKNEYPHGHPHLAVSLKLLGSLVHSQRDYAGARAYYERALTMYQALYPKDRYPKGHPELASCLNHLGMLRNDQADYAGARTYYQQALAMCQALYPKEQNPRLAGCLNNLGLLLQDLEDYAGARGYHEQALAMVRALYSKEQYPRGAPPLATSLNNMGLLLVKQGDYAGARNFHAQALAMWQALYPEDRYPHGYSQVANCMTNLAVPLQFQGDYSGALGYLQQALDMYEGLAEILMPAVSEAEALNHLASLPLTRDLFLSVSRHLPDSDAACYAQVWRGKGAIFRILRSRQQALRQLTDSEGRDLWDKLVQTRRELARLILSPPRDLAFHRQRLQELTELKEELERQLAGRSAPFRRQQEQERLTPTDLARKLPPRSVFIDLLRYVRFEHDPKVPGIKGETWIPHYVAFVLRPGQPPLRVEIGKARPIDAAVATWRRDLARPAASAAGQTLRRLVWDKLSPHLPADTRTVLLAPDGALTQLPWAALPGKRPGSVLLEDYAFAVVPHGPFLLERLSATPRSAPDSGLLLAVGAIQYDQEPRSIPKVKPEQLLAWRPAERGSRTVRWTAEQAAGTVHAAAAGPFEVFPFFLTAWPTWSYLPGTLREIESVRRLAEPRPVQIRRGAEATTAQLMRDLPQARYALLATHGFFADPEFRSVFLLDEAAFRHHRPEGRATPGARNPLVLSGLVLAGANKITAGNGDGVAAGDGSILTAEMIVSLPLEHLELAVLSACETGLGEVAGGEGVYGLQRAFHMAGAQTTVASLWQVDDEITQELLTRFFENLWHKGMGRLEALRQAQLAVRRGEGNRAHPRYWAAWVLSGDPGELDSAPGAAPVEPPAVVAAEPWWSGWPLYAAGVGVLGLVLLGLIAYRRRRGTRDVGA
jgi:CHAT domain-containing protein/Tfp pilus assembly protein PilF